EVWLGDVGENVWEEINVIPALPDTGAALTNFGWPCMEGRFAHGGFDVPICQALAQPGGGRTPLTEPWYAYNHGSGPDVGSGSDVTGLQFYEGTLYPPEYQHSLFFADNSRTVIFNVPFVDANGDGFPDAPADDTATGFYDGSNATAVQLTSGPGGDIFFANLLVGRISRLSYCDGCTNLAPSAAIALDAGSTADGAPRTITFTAANSVDPDAGDTVTYDWDLDGDGVFGDASGVTAFRFYGDEGSYRVAVRVTDSAGASDMQSMLVTIVGQLGDADVGVTLDDGVIDVFPGDTITYTMVVTNYGSSLVPGEAVATTLAPLLTNVEWTCSGSEGTVCAATGSGDVDDLVDLPAGATATYTIDARIPTDASGAVLSHATVLPPDGYGDPNSTDNIAFDTDSISLDRIFADGFDPF
ncbi:MAG TPA: PKD domain-containing protein, partial [Rhodanobacteraceae bacterium]|nr:PKD domain-containing protein [Rhodanobacteraceae bacterium]